eukprot:361669-Rhodomonas_salina.1
MRERMGSECMASGEAEQRGAGAGVVGGGDEQRERRVLAGAGLLVHRHRPAPVPRRHARGAQVGQPLRGPADAAAGAGEGGGGELVAGARGGARVGARRQRAPEPRRGAPAPRGPRAPAPHVADRLSLPPVLRNPMAQRPRRLCLLALCTVLLLARPGPGLDASVLRVVGGGGGWVRARGAALCLQGAARCAAAGVRVLPRRRAVAESAGRARAERMRVVGGRSCGMGV